MSTIIGYLIGQVGQLSGARFAIPESGLIIGRDPNHAGLVVEDSLVSRQHAKIAPAKDGQLYLIDLKSRNGTSLNGKKVTTPVTLIAGDKIELGTEGKVIFIFESADTTSLSGVLKEAFGETVAPVAWKPGDVIGGKYEVKRTLGKGGFGVVYLVRDRETGQISALKTFRDELLTDGKAREAFKKESLLWVNLDEHPFIVKARWVEVFSGRLFVEMDYVAPDDQGRLTLANHLAKASEPLDSAQVLEWSIQFCLGMEHANAHGIKCHRDIKPANILIGKDGVFKIADFGLAVAAEIAGLGSASQGGPVVTGSEENGFGFSVVQAGGKVRCGTPGYMPPEVYRCEGADIRSDIYSFGLVLWQMATGSKIPPFVRSYNSDAGTFMRDVYDQQMAFRLPRISRPLWPVVKCCLRAKPTRRYRDFSELREDLTHIFQKKTGRTVHVPEAGVQSTAFWNRKGASLNALGRHEEAISCFDKALEIDLQNTAWDKKKLDQLGIESIIRIGAQDVAAWNNKGTSLNALGRHEEAIECFDMVLKIDPRDSGIWNNKGTALLALGRHGEAIQCYDKALMIDPGDGDHWYNKGNLLKHLARHEEAIECYNKAVAIDSRHAYAWHNMGTSLADLGRHEEAISCYGKALAIDPRDGKALLNTGNALDSLGRYEEAIRCYDKALEINPRHARAWNNKGCSHYRLDQNKEAIVCCDKALKIDPRYLEALSNKGAALSKLGRHEEAIGCDDKALEIDPRYTNAWCNKGITFARLGQLEVALRCYATALEIDPRNSEAWFNKGTALFRLGQREEVISCYDKVLEIDPRHATALSNKGAILAELGRNEEAIGCYNITLKINPRDPEAWFNKGASHSDLGRHEEAIGCYNKALDIDQRYANAWINKGNALTRLGRHEEAISCYDNALQIDSHVATAWYNKALAEDAIGKSSKAIRSYRTFVELSPAQTASEVEYARQRLKELEK